MLGITAFNWCSDKKEFYAAWNTKCKVLCREASQLVYDHGMDASKVLKIKQDMAKDLLQKLNKRKAETAGLDMVPNRNVRANTTTTTTVVMPPPTPVQVTTMQMTVPPQHAVPAINNLVSNQTN